MLDRAGNADCHIQIGTDGLASLPNLMGIWNPACIHRCAAGPNGPTQHIRQFADRREAFRPTDSASTRNDDAGVGQINRAFGLFKAGDFRRNLIFTQDRRGANDLATL